MEEKKLGLLLLSGGIDSPVAGFLVKRAGFRLAAVHFSSEPFVGPEIEEKCGVLAKKIGAEEFLAENVGKDLEELASKCKYSLYYVLQKRLLLRRADKIAGKIGADFLVTGENLGQVSSQTLSNLAVIDSATRLPIARPLISFDKEEIIAIARKLGTFEISKGPEACCVLGPKHPATFSNIGQVLEEEQKLK
ncbi:MAG: hypothetical protein V1820_02290 [archaeon]